MEQLNKMTKAELLTHIDVTTKEWVEHANKQAVLINNQIGKIDKLDKTAGALKKINLELSKKNKSFADENNLKSIAIDELKKIHTGEISNKNHEIDSLHDEITTLTNKLNKIKNSIEAHIEIDYAQDEFTDEYKNTYPMLISKKKKKEVRRLERILEIIIN